MQVILHKSYKNMTDKDIVDLIIAGNEEAMLYLLYDRYENDLKFYAWRYYDSLAYLEDLINYLYIQFKGKNGDWQPLKSFQWKCKFRTWFCSVASHLFLEKREEMIGLGGKDGSKGTDGGDKPIPEPTPEPENQKLVMLMEAINRLENDDYRFILIKELEGYNMKIKDIVTLTTTSITPKSSEEYHLYSLPSFDDNQKSEELIGSEIQSNKYIVPDKCILFNKLNVRFKRVWRIDNNDYNKICSTEFLPLVVNESKVDYQYCYYILISDYITNYLCGQNANTSGSHKRIDPTDFLNIELPTLPAMEEQKRIGQLLFSIDQKIALNRAINDNLPTPDRSSAEAVIRLVA